VLESRVRRVERVAKIGLHRRTPLIVKTFDVTPTHQRLYKLLRFLTQTECSRSRNRVGLERVL
jgi:hypothetical protein